RLRALHGGVPAGSRQRADPRHPRRGGRHGRHRPVRADHRDVRRPGEHPDHPGARAPDAARRRGRRPGEHVRGRRRAPGRWDSRRRELTLQTQPSGHGLRAQRAPEPGSAGSRPASDIPRRARMTTTPTPQAALDAAAPGAPDARAAGRVLGLACGATFLAFFDTTVVNIAFSDLHKSFPNVTLARLTWVVTAYAVFFAALLASAGRLAAVVGRRRLFVLSVVAFAVPSALAAAAPNANTLVVARALQGACAAGMIPSALGLLLASTPPQKRHAAI